MKNAFKVICVALTLVFSIGSVKSVYADGISTCSVLEYSRTVSSDSGRITTVVKLVVQDSNDTILSYSITGIKCAEGVSSVSVLESGITADKKQVSVKVGYTYENKYTTETIYIGA
jgi:hypothetical protein